MRVLPPLKEIRERHKKILQAVGFKSNPAYFFLWSLGIPLVWILIPLVTTAFCVLIPGTITTLFHFGVLVVLLLMFHAGWGAFIVEMNMARDDGRIKNHDVANKTMDTFKKAWDQNITWLLASYAMSTLLALPIHREALGIPIS